MELAFGDANVFKPVFTRTIPHYTTLFGMWYIVEPITVYIDHTYVAISSGISSKAVTRIVVDSIWTVSMETGWTLTFINIYHNVCLNTNYEILECHEDQVLEYEKIITKVEASNYMTKSRPLLNNIIKYPVYFTPFHRTNMNTKYSFLTWVFIIKIRIILKRQEKMS